MKTNSITIPSESGKLKADRLYSGDNCRMFCGTLQCAGQRAFFGGASPVSPRDVLDWAEMSAEYGTSFAMCCEGCCKVATVHAGKVYAKEAVCAS